MRHAAVFSGKERTLMIQIKLGFSWDTWKIKARRENMVLP
jgi:hypothetical protein